MVTIILHVWISVTIKYNKLRHGKKKKTRYKTDILYQLKCKYWLEADVCCGANKYIVNS